MLYYVSPKDIGILSGYQPEKYYRRIAELIEENEVSDQTHCRQCEKCKRTVFELKKINWITINTSWYCNSSCIYCTAHYATKEDGHEVLGVIQKFHEQDLFTDDCMFDWGGGEPTLNPIFDRTATWLSDHKYYQRINTNGLKYSEATEYALRNGSAILRLSLDSGTEECFEKVKGNSGYSEVWKNIRKYREATDQIYLKYNVFNYNSDSSEVDAFLDHCEKAGIKYVVVDGEVSSYQPRKNAGPFYYTKKEFEAMHRLHDEAQRRGFIVSISDYAFSYRAEYNNRGQLILPTHYFDNTDRTIISNNIYVYTEPSVDALVHKLYNTQKKLIIRGYGTDGKCLLKILDHYHIHVDYIVDNERMKDRAVVSVDNYLKEDSDCIVILASTKHWKEFLKEINVAEKRNFEPIYMQGYHFRKYAEERGIG